VLLGPGPKRRCRSNVAIDYSTGLAEALAHLQKLGHENIAVATGPQNQVSAIEYRKTVLEEMKKRRVKPFRILEGDHRPESGARAAREILSGRQRPTALLCANDRMAIGAIGAAVDLGLRVPEDLSVIGADDIWIARYCQPPLTTVRIPRDTLGRMAFDILIGMIRAKGKMGSEHVLKTELVVRRSTGADGKRLKEETVLREREMAGTRANA
jgi:LacI family transcriptional regulator, repressor for deo operon, udp, cdd, tsx, nupC, and nupG